MTTTTKKLDPALLKSRVLRMADGSMTAAEIASALGFADRQTTAHLSLLKKMGLIAGWTIDKDSKKIKVDYKRGRGYDDLVGEPASPNGAAGPAAGPDLQAAAKQEFAAVDPELAAKVSILRAAGTSFKAIAEELAIPVSQVRRIVRAAEAAQ